ncbi:hypothetical protein C2845_PM07G10140 [Panicum miliaceum]|uniref:Uncharacterized protein n=1 Tax=Panicum miliaceum TaxID=4540 RepID=A0A3L6SMV9_PANMI|nr:hypothetical protein C2845_PM07G10140 [Panicum miliaceum]
MTWVTCITTPADRSPILFVMVTDTGTLDPVLLGPVIRPALDLALRVDNPMDPRMCRENATFTVQDFCVHKGASTEVVAVLLRADVVLTDDLRRSMASELRAGEMEVLVELRLLFPKGDHECQLCARDKFQYCRVWPGQGYAPCHCRALEFTQISESFGQ